MFRRPRLKLDGIPIHIRKPGNNRNACFYADEDDQFYLESLDGYCHDEKVKVHAYVLMTNHVPMLVTPTDKNGPLLMKRLGQLMCNISIVPIFGMEVYGKVVFVPARRLE